MSSKYHNHYTSTKFRIFQSYYLTPICVFHVLLLCLLLIFIFDIFLFGLACNVILDRNIFARTWKVGVGGRNFLLVEIRCLQRSIKFYLEKQNVCTLLERLKGMRGAETINFRIIFSSCCLCTWVRVARLCNLHTDEDWFIFVHFPVIFHAVHQMTLFYLRFPRQPGQLN